ncbi:MAG: FG-GAP-like repeat-containing protein, partial [bacterium]
MKLFTKYLIYHVCFLAFVLLLAGCEKKQEPDPETTKNIISSRTLGLAFLEENRLEEAEAEFKKLIELAPDEALGYANLGLVYLRLGRYEEAETRIRQAVDLAPDDADIRLMLAEVLNATNRQNEAQAELEKSLQKSPGHVKTLFALAEDAKNSSAEDGSLRAETYLAKIVNLLPANLAARIQLTETLLKNDKADSALANLEEIRRQMPELPKESQDFFDRAIAALHTNDTQTAFSSTVIFHNFLKLTPLYQAGIQELKGPGGALAGSPVLTFSRDISIRPGSEKAILEALHFTDASTPAGLDIVARRQQKIDPFAEPGTVVAVADFDRDRQQDLFISATDDLGITERFLLKNDIGQFVEITSTSGIRHTGKDFAAIFADYNNDGYLDLCITNENGNVLYQNIDVGKFSNATAEAGIAGKSIGLQPIFADLDHDGDLDLFLANAGSNTLFRNNLDGTFTEHTIAAGLAGKNVKSRDTAFADFDDDGDLDLALVNDDGALILYTNLRQGKFQDIAGESGLGGSNASGNIAIADYDNDGFVDILTTSLNGGAALYLNQGEGRYQKDNRSGDLAKLLDGVSGLDAEFFDFDNDGFVDLLVAGTPVDQNPNERAVYLFRNDGTGVFVDFSSILPEDLLTGQRIALMDYNEDGDLDFLITGLDGSVRLIRNDGGNANKYLKVGLVGVRTGSGKNNHFGIGSKLEVRAGDLYQMRVVTSPMTHVGLGQRLKADVVRILWPNGTPQNLFYPGSDQDLVEEQTLKGSCAFLYTWTGEKFEFHTDIMWRSALGMPLGIMGGESAFAAPLPTNEFVRIPGERLQAKDGKYILQITEELWETAYIEKIQLVAVDHPESVDIFVNESFTPPPYPPHRIFQAGKRHLPKSVKDEHGNDLLPAIAKKDDRYVSNLKPARYQGMTALHDLVLDLGDVPKNQPVKLFLNGWIFPSDASINVAVSQAKNIEAISPYLQMPDKNRRWQTVDDRIGFPMGKNKTMVIDLTEKFLSNDHRVRLRTNMEIYWDSIFYTVGEPETELVQTTLSPISADLHYRGFSKLYRKGGRYGPHWFDYNDVSTEPKWRDLTGYYTRYGDVLELLLESESKVAIVNAGDEITVTFDAKKLPALKSGWTRDFLIYSDGWIKDG